MGAMPVSVVIPVYNEAANIDELVERLGHALSGRDFELIFVDDRSTDETSTLLAQRSTTFPISTFVKSGQKGKAYSLIEGIRQAKYPHIAFIDGDLQYPPEAIPGMLEQLECDALDVVVASRHHHEGLLRTFVSRSFNLMYRMFVRDLHVDIQSGLKVFKKEVFERANLHPTPWTFDFEFLLQSRYAGYRIGSYTIDFQPRAHGDSKVKVMPAAIEITTNFVRTLIRTPNLVHFTDRERTEDGSGFYYRGKRYVTHNSIPDDHSAVRRLTPTQSGILISLLLFIVGLLVFNWHIAVVTFISILTILYFFDLLFNLFLIFRSYGSNDHIQVSELDLQGIQDWPRYTIFCPLYKESNILPQFVDAMKQLDYPKRKLQVMLLLEADDTETIAVAEKMNLPAYFQIEVVPHSMPKTKPKACNYGLKQATGEYAVIYDAEDIPDPKQLKKAIVAFRRVAEGQRQVGCIQAKLNFYNWQQNVLTHMFALEYSLWFDLVLTGLQSIGAPIPLGGTSNHFRVEHLRSFGGWDPFNVTEDADLGIRLSKKGYTTLILDSTTLEEANSQYGNWIRQRSRWIKGYMQTFFVHNRKVTRLTNHRDYIIFQLVVGGKVLSALLNPLFWTLTILYFFAHTPKIDSFIHGLYPAPVYYIGIVTLVIGNFLYMYYYMLGAAKRQHYELILYALLVPFYWSMMSIAAYKALQEFIVKPFHWQKTRHGLHLISSSKPQENEMSIEASTP